MVRTALLLETKHFHNSVSHLLRNTLELRINTKGMPEATVIFGVEAAGQVYNQTNVFAYLGGDANHDADLSIEVNRRMVQLPEVHPRTVRPTKGSPRAQSPDAKSRGNDIRLRHMEPARVPLHDTLRRAYHSFLTRYIGWRKDNRTDHPISYLGTLMKTGSVDVIIRRKQILFAELVAHMEDPRLPKCVMFGELMGGAGCVGGRGESGWGIFWTTSKFPVSALARGRLQPRRGRRNGARRWNKRQNV